MKHTIRHLVAVAAVLLTAACGQPPEQPASTKETSANAVSAALPPGRPFGGRTGKVIDTPGTRGPHLVVDDLVFVAPSDDMDGEYEICRKQAAAWSSTCVTTQPVTGTCDWPSEVKDPRPGNGSGPKAERSCHTAMITVDEEECHSKTDHPVRVFVDVMEQGPRVRIVDVYLWSDLPHQCEDGAKEFHAGGAHLTM